jgi:Fe-S-cluster containining protein
MEFDFSPFFIEYEAVAATADKTFDSVKTKYLDLVNCKIKCTDCCYALFDVSLIEAVYINRHFNETIEEKARQTICEKANKIDRTIYKIKRNAYKQLKAGKDENAILTDMAKEKVPCALLNDRQECDLYLFRPITCRLYGIPAAIGGAGRTCGKSGFKKGESYQTVYLDVLFKRLYEISERMVESINSKYDKIAEILMPLSMALITDFGKEFFGIKES